MAEHKEINFTDRNAVEKFLEGEQFRPCANLKCAPVNLAYQILYLPTCLENRFHREGIAEHLEMPLLSRPLSPMTYQSVGVWAPLVSCPSDCKGFRSPTVAKIQQAASTTVRRLFTNSKAGGKEKPWWKEWTTLIVTGVIVGIVVLVLTPYFTKSTTSTEPSPRSQPEQKLEAKPTQPSTDDVKPIAPAKPPSRNVGGVVTDPVQGKPPATQNCADNKGLCIGGDNNGQANFYQSTPEPAVVEWEHFVDPNQSLGAKHPVQVVRAWVNHAYENARFAVVCDRPCTSLHFNMPGHQQTSTGSFSDEPNLAVFMVCLPNPFPPTTRAMMSVESTDDQPVHVIKVVKIEWKDDKSCQ